MLDSGLNPNCCFVLLVICRSGVLRLLSFASQCSNLRPSIVVGAPTRSFERIRAGIE
ncbi:hypothetical protein [Methanomethylovorans hollandica]|uniref:hypothetical protein n=1 Tax=Methanomethylovorans hollandica TaxID=101192 RepID=UPI0012EA49CA|nr:hypothetical protein [Methanomethylovorans hollandica]